MLSMLSIGTIKRPVSHIAAHEHLFWEVVYYIEGSGVIQVGEKSLSFKTGDMIFLPPNIPHSEKSVQTFRNFHIILASCTIPASPILKIRDTNSKDIYNLLIMLYREFHLRRQNHEMIMVSILDLIEKYVMIQTGQNGPSVIEKCKEILIDNISNPSFRLETMFSKMNYNPDYVRRLFRKEVGLSPNSFLIQKRMEYAKLLLASSSSMDLIIKEIGFRCGYTDPFLFSRIFKKHVGVSPTEYIRLCGK